MKAARLAMALPNQSQSAEAVGQKVLAGLAKGRLRAITQGRARAAQQHIVVAIAVSSDRAAGKPARCLAGRISRKLSGAISERHIRRILDTLSSPFDSPR